MSEGFAGAVVLAAGAGRRMGGIDKVLLPLGGRPALAWSLAEMAVARSVSQIVVVTEASRLAALAADPFVRAVGASVVAGGTRRQDSVARGFAGTDAEVILVHDGARPFVRAELIDAVAFRARDQGAAIPVAPVADSLKRLDGEGHVASAARAGILRAQTPQGVQRELLARSIAEADRTGQTYGDEAEMLEAIGVPVSAVPGDATNIKLTEPADLRLAAALAGSATGSPRYASATDSHPFGPGDGLILGGLSIPDAPRLAGHSDGDVALHAIADALLSAAGLPDLGRLFPASDPATFGIDSSDLLRQVLERITRAGAWPISVDLSITAARPRLGGARLDAMRDRIAALLGLEPAWVTVKASSGNLTGSEGAGRSIVAGALAAVVWDLRSSGTPTIGR